jgi:hypothetical protein
MKRIIAKLAIIVSILVIVAGCREITVNTKVHVDGSCERTVSIQGDSSDVLDSRFPTPRDSTWTIKAHRLEKGDKKFEYKASKTFARFEDMNAFFDASDDSIRLIRSRVDLKRRFRWFITVYRYEEVYRVLNPFQHIALNEYMTEEELAMLMSEEENKEVEKKYEMWGQKNMLEEFLTQFITAAAKKEDPKLAKAYILEKREELYVHVFEEGYEGGDDVESILLALENVLGTPSVRTMRSEVETIVDEIDRQVEFLMEADSDSYTNIVTMPGLILDTNAGQIEGNRVAWEVKTKKFMDCDYTMWVESRSVNRWIIFLTALVILIPVAWSIIRAVKQGSFSPSA